MSNQLVLRPIDVSFTDTPQEEISRFIRELQLVKLADAIQTGKQLPEDVSKLLGELLHLLVDMFSIDMPLITGDPEEDLRVISRDINISRIVKEKALFRLWLLLRVRDKEGIVVYKKFLHPDTGEPFPNQEEFLGWFCSNAHATRATVFQRNATYDRMHVLGFDPEEAFRVVLSKPSVITEKLRELADWEKGGEIRSLNPGIVVNAAELIQHPLAEEIAELAEQYDDPDVHDEFTEKAKTVFSDLMREVAAHDRAKEAAKFVDFGVLRKPEIKYSWNLELDTLMIEYVKKSVDNSGTEYIEKVQRFPMFADTTDFPDDVKKDLIKRLPISNRNMLDV